VEKKRPVFLSTRASHEQLVSFGNQMAGGRLEFAASDIAIFGAKLIERVAKTSDVVPATLTTMKSTPCFKQNP